MNKTITHILDYIGYDCLNIHCKECPEDRNVCIKAIEIELAEINDNFEKIKNGEKNVKLF